LGLCNYEPEFARKEVKVKSSGVKCESFSWNLRLETSFLNVWEKLLTLMTNLKVELQKKI